MRWWAMLRRSHFNIRRSTADLYQVFRFLRYSVVVIPAYPQLSVSISSITIWVRSANSSAKKLLW